MRFAQSTRLSPGVDHSEGAVNLFAAHFSSWVLNVRLEVSVRYTQNKSAVERQSLISKFWISAGASRISGIRPDADLSHQRTTPDQLSAIPAATSRKFYLFRTV
jgi:hypothetical protein